MSRCFDIASSRLLNVEFLRGLALTAPNILLVDHSESAGLQRPAMSAMLEEWEQPVLFNDTTTTALSLQQGNPEFGRAPAGQLLNPVETAGVC